MPVPNVRKGLPNKLTDLLRLHSLLFTPEDHLILVPQSYSGIDATDRFCQGVADDVLLLEWTRTRLLAALPVVVDIGEYVGKKLL